MGRLVRITERRTGQRLLTQVETPEACLAAEARTQVEATQLEKRLQELEHLLKART